MLGFIRSFTSGFFTPSRRHGENRASNSSQLSANLGVSNTVRSVRSRTNCLKRGGAEARRKMRWETGSGLSTEPALPRVRSPDSSSVSPWWVLFGCGSAALRESPQRRYSCNWRVLPDQEYKCFNQLNSPKLPHARAVPGTIKTAFTGSALWTQRPSFSCA